MKTLRHILFSLALGLPAMAAAQCQVSFSYTTNNLTVAFIGNVSPAPGPTTNFYWWFSDNGNYSTYQNPVYTFSQAGTYTVCFSVWDASSGCSDSVCMPVTVTGTSSCNADFTWIDTSGYTYFLGNSTAGPGAMYVWDFGDGNYSNNQYEWHQYASPGTYLACLTVYDSNQVFCDSTCHYVTVSGGGCQVDFTWIDSLGYTFFISNSTLGSGGYYMWDFGDGNYSTMMNPSHVYASPGYYMVCVIVYDSMQVFCDSTCHTVFVQSVGTFDLNALDQSVEVAPNPADQSMTVSFFASAEGEISLSMYDASGRICMQETKNVQQAGNGKIEMNTSQVPQGIYLIRLEMNGAVAWKKIALTHQ